MFTLSEWYFIDYTNRNGPELLDLHHVTLTYIENEEYILLLL